MLWELFVQLDITVLLNQQDQHLVQQVLTQQAHSGRNHLTVHHVYKATIAQLQQQLRTPHMSAQPAFIVQQVVLLQLKLFAQSVIDAQLVAHPQHHVQVQTNIKMKLVPQFVKIALSATTVLKLHQLNANLKMKVQTTTVLVAW